MWSPRALAGGRTAVTCPPPAPRRTSAPAGPGIQLARPTRLCTICRMSTWTAPERAGTPRTPDERTSLESWLEFHRATLLGKCANLQPEQLVIRSCPPSTLSLLGLIRHMTDVESWFHGYDLQPEDDGYCTEESPDADFEDLDPAEADRDLAAYLASVKRSREAVIGHDLDELLPGARSPISLRWVYQHMIEEYARHNGHADLIRQAIDGATDS